MRQTISSPSSSSSGTVSIFVDRRKISNLIFLLAVFPFQFFTSSFLFSLCLPVPGSTISFHSFKFQVFDSRQGKQIVTVSLDIY
jgi:hypothetical protein